MRVLMITFAVCVAFFLIRFSCGRSRKIVLYLIVREMKSSPVIVKCVRTCQFGFQSFMTRIRFVVYPASLFILRFFVFISGVDGHRKLFCISSFEYSRSMKSSPVIIKCLRTCHLQFQICLTCTRNANYVIYIGQSLYTEVQLSSNSK